MEITVKWSGISNASTEFYGFASDVGNCVASIRAISNNLKIPNKVKYQIKYSINAKCDSLNNVQKKLRGMGSTLNQAQHQYRSTENQIVANGKATGIVTPQAFASMPTLWGSVSAALGSANINLVDALWKKMGYFNPSMLGTLAGIGSILGRGTASFIDVIKGNKTLGMKIKGSWISNSETISGNILGFSASTTRSRELVGGSLKTKFSSGISFSRDEKTGKTDYSKYNINLIEAKVAAEGHLLQSKLENNIGLFSNSTTTTVGQVEGSGKLGISLVKDGKLSPVIEAKIGAGVTGLKNESSMKFGTDDYNAHVNTTAKFLNANLEAKGAVGVIRSEDENGKEKVEFGAKGSVGAEAYLAEGKISGGFTVFGIDVNIGAEGKAGGAGAKAEGKLTTGGVSGKVDLGLGLGAGLSIDIDWSGFKGFKGFKLF